MAVTYRRPHPRVVSATTRYERESAKPRIIETTAGEFKAVYPPSVNRAEVFGRAHTRYTMVRGHLVRIHQPEESLTMPAERKLRSIRQMQALRAARGNKCAVCDRAADYTLDPVTGTLEWAHIAETGLSGAGRGSKERVIDISQHPESYELMCKPCHKRFDALLGPVPKHEQHYIRTGA